MAKTESTAVNELIDLVQNRKAPPEPAADLFSAPRHPPRMTSTIPAVRDVEPLPRQRAPQATSEQRRSPMAGPSVRMSTAEPERGTTIPPLSAPRASSRSLPPPLRMSPAGTLPPPARTSPPMTAPIAAPFESRPALPQQFPIVQPPDAPADHWYEATPAPATRKSDETFALIKKLIAPTIALSVVMVGGYFAFFGKPGKKPQPAPATAPSVLAERAGETEEVVLRPAPPQRESDNAATPSAGGAQPEPPTKAEQAAEIAAATMTQEAPNDAVAAIAPSSGSPAPAMREVKTAQGVISFADVRIDSDPPGATVTLVDGGTQSFLGSTPLSTSVDASREYDVIIALDGRPTQMVHLDPRTTSRLDVSLGRKVPRVRTSRALRPARDGAASEPDQPAPAAAVIGTGTLMVSSKPPCDLYIDDKPTGLMTPQRSIELSAGTHTVTFVNEAQGIKKTVSVKITADQPTKLIQDLMAE